MVKGIVQATGIQRQLSEAEMHQLVLVLILSGKRLLEYVTGKMLPDLSSAENERDIVLSTRNVCVLTGDLFWSDPPDKPRTRSAHLSKTYSLPPQRDLALLCVVSGVRVTPGDSAAALADLHLM